MPRMKKEEDKEKKALSYLKNNHVSLDDVVQLAKAVKTGNPGGKNVYKVKKQSVKYLAISDSHIGSIYYDKDLLSHAVNMANREKVDFIIHAGDILDGWYQNRPQQVFELEAIGLDQQVKLSLDELGKFKQPFYFITGNHEYNTFMRGAGVEVGSILEDGLKDKGLEAIFLGNAEGDLELKTGTRIKILHPDSLSSYAISYRSQKIAESLEGGKKPGILHIGNMHKAEYLFYRNIHIFQAATLENQTKFMRGRHIAAMKGFWIIGVYADSMGGIDAIEPRFYPAYD